MRKRLSQAEKRDQIIGIKVKKETKEMIQYISKREERPMSTQINIILDEYIKEYAKKWNLDITKEIEEAQINEKGETDD